MATKTATVAQPDTSEAREDGPDAPLLDTLGAELKKLVQKGKERWEIGRTADTKVKGGDLKVGEKIFFSFDPQRAICFPAQAGHHG